MNKRPFLFGLGVGINVGAALLQLMLIGEKQASSLDDFDKGTKTSVTYTQADLDKRLAEEKERIQTEVSKEAKLHKEIPKQDKAAQNELKNEEQPAIPTPAAADQKSADQQTGETKTTGSAQRILLHIPANSSVTETADLLFKMAVIHNKQTFINLMRKDIIRAGYFAFEGSPTLQQVKTIITSTPIPPAQAEAELKKEIKTKSDYSTKASNPQ